MYSYDKFSEISNLISSCNIQEQWGFYFKGEERTLYNEQETWNVIAHVNKRYSYGKSLRYSDRFYRNWAIRAAQEDDKIAAQRNEDRTMRESSYGRH